MRDLIGWSLVFLGELGHWKTMTNTTQQRGARPFGGFERMVARRYMGATKAGSGASLITVIALSLIALSVAALIVVMSVFQGFRVNLLSQLLSVNGHVFVADSFGEMADYDEELAQLRAVPGVIRATPILRVEGYAIGRRDQGAAQVIGITRDNLLQIPEFNERLRGNLDTFGEGKNGGSDVAIGWRLAAILGVGVGDVFTLATAGGAETPFGRQPFTQKNFRVAAVFSIGNSVLDQYFMYMPLAQAQSFSRQDGLISEIEIRVTDAIDIAPWRSQIEGMVGGNRVVADWTERNSDIFNAVQVERGLMRIIMLMIVSVAVVNIISGLVMMVKDKRSDIAIMRTMGTTQGAIMRIFMLVGAAIGTFGALLGVVLGWLVATNLDVIERGLSRLFGFRVFNPEIYFLDEIPSVFEWHEVGVVVGFTLVMSFIAAAYPAWRASKVEPVEALRYE